jgi:2-(1,2-epoxy-1,2-dihydrophenyl)acetyl-CoA isomerase
METLVVERTDSGIATVTMNRPDKKNAVDDTMWEELLATFRSLAPDPAVRVVVLTGAGGAFCSGADLSSDFAGNAAAGAQLAFMRRLTEVVLALHRLPKPTIAKVGGVAVGAGANLAFGCDLIVASDEARFSEIFVKRGLSIDGGGSWLLPRLIGLHKAKELAFFADIISAKEAEEFGLVNRVVAAAELDAFVDGWAARLAAGAPIALAQTKQLLNSGGQVSLEDAAVAEGAAQTVNFSTEDLGEAVQAFLRKREPVFKGR